MALISVSNNALQNITAVPASVASGALVLLSTQTASSSASLSFTSGIDSTYDSYVFKFYNIHPQTDTSEFDFQASTDGGSTYATTLTSTVFFAQHHENDTGTKFEYNSGEDSAQSTDFQTLFINQGSDADENGSGTLTIYNPSSTTFVKHFISRCHNNHYDNRTGDVYVAGYFNTTNAINAIRFQFSSGNIDDGIIKMYGVK
jgi:hypothetical protein